MLFKYPLELPEIADMVALYLEGKDLAGCVRVCKRWRDLFLSHRWRDIRVGTRRADLGWTKHWVGPHPDHVYSHRHLIQNLKIQKELAGLDKHHYPNLRQLEIDLSDVACYRESEFLSELREMFPVLEHLRLKSVRLASTFWESFVVHPHIKILELDRIDIQ